MQSELRIHRRTTRLERLLFAILALILIALPGCAMMQDTVLIVARDLGLPDVRGKKNFREMHEAEAKHREEFQLNKSEKSLDWLLANRIHSGMREEQVSIILGEQGVPEVQSQGYKTGSNYLHSDNAYRWGPDEKGRSVVLFFRDGQLVHFNPDDFRK